MAVLTVGWDLLGFTASTGGEVICGLVTLTLVIPGVMLWPELREAHRERREEQREMRAALELVNRLRAAGKLPELPER